MKWHWDNNISFANDAASSCRHHAGHSDPCFQRIPIFQEMDKVLGRLIKANSSPRLVPGWRIGSRSGRNGTFPLVNLKRRTQDIANWFRNEIDFLPAGNTERCTSCDWLTAGQAARGRDDIDQSTPAMAQLTAQKLE